MAGSWLNASLTVLKHKFTVWCGSVRYGVVRSGLARSGAVAYGVVCLGGVG